MSAADHYPDPARSVPVLLPLAVPGPYSYLAGRHTVAPGDVVEVPLGNRTMTGIVWDNTYGDADVAADKLKTLTSRFDCPPIPQSLRALVDWISAYNLTPPGMVLRAVMRSQDALFDPKPGIGVRYVGGEPARMTPARARVLEASSSRLAYVKSDLAKSAGVSASVIDGLLDLGILETVAIAPVLPFEAANPDFAVPDLSGEQDMAARALIDAVNTTRFSTTLLDGVTGSGKTEVYFEAVAQAVRAGRQGLVLLPEIALTRQFLDRFETRFGVRPAEWHSAITPRRREDTWRAVHRGQVQVVVGARSALLLPFKDLGVIIVDEEHDGAYKQDDRMSYHARDMAVVRGHISKIAVVLCSATPSIETKVNADSGKYACARLPDRYQHRTFPKVEAIDLRADAPDRGKWLAPQLVAATQQVLSSGGQALLFLNRRGYAPLTLCRTCGHRFMCPDCSAWLVEHRFRGALACHHCGYSVAAPKMCPNCGEEGTLIACGPGVERVAEEALELFPDARTTILSSDLLGGMEDVRRRFTDIAAGHFNLIIGTQLIAKGHHFPHLELVGVVDGDLGLGHGDLRAAERTYQVLHQVVGRAGRGETPGNGLIQTHMPEHPVVQALVSGDREAFYAAEIAARQRELLPPFGKLAALIISGRDKARTAAFARQLARTAPHADDVRVLGPADAPLALVRGRHRVRLLVKAQINVNIQAYLRAWMAEAGHPRGGIRLAIDVDPQNFY